MYRWCNKSSGQWSEVRGQENPEGAGIFIRLLIGSVFGISLLAFLIWWVPTIGLANINTALPYILAILLVSLIIFMFVSAFLLALSASGRTVPFPGKLRGLLVKLFFPVVSFL
ncbi:MAG: hypothetical protein AAB275_01280, partial [Deltaproteobacteria bacterium]